MKLLHRDKKSGYHISKPVHELQKEPTRELYRADYVWVQAWLVYQTSPKMKLKLDSFTCQAKRTDEFHRAEPWVAYERLSSFTPLCIHIWSYVNKEVDGVVLYWPFNFVFVVICASLFTSHTHVCVGPRAEMSIKSQPTGCLYTKAPIIEKIWSHATFDI